MSMVSADEYVEGFMSRMKSGKFDKDCQKNEGPQLTDEFIESQAEEFRKLLDNDLINEVMDGVGNE